MIDWNPIILSLKLSFFTTVILFIISIPIAWWLSGKKSIPKIIIDAIVTLPMVLPPTVIGFYLLVAFSPENFFGKWLMDNFDLQLSFSFPGLLIGSLLYSLPFMVQPIKAGFSAIPIQLKETAYTLGKSKWTTLFRVILPNSKEAILNGIMLSFAHTMGEFGVVLMIGGNIPDKTRTASIALYDEVNNFNYQFANYYAVMLILISFTILIFLQIYTRRKIGFPLFQNNR